MIESVTISYDEFKALTRDQEKLEHIKRECRIHNRHMLFINNKTREGKEIQDIMDYLTLLNAKTLGTIKNMALK